ncbi:MAG: helix-turn-helix transcriptional regulator [Simkaniaceae bacterium]|nr:helix-turn-helix transcriptional regulator [Simkaniaceae bacterium]
MRKTNISELILLQEIEDQVANAKGATRGLSIGSLIKMIRTQIGMSQLALAKRSGVPQPTISRLERGGSDIQISTLEKVLNGLACELFIAPLLQESVDMMRKKQARKKAKIRVDYTIGTMNLEKQAPDPTFTQALLREEENCLLNGPNKDLWNEESV